jgi:hypothetical protein
MSLAVRDSHFPSLYNLPVNTRRTLHRRSSCSSIPRTVSICSTGWGFNLSSEDSRNPAYFLEETYMSPLFRGLEGSGATHKAEEQMTILPENCTPDVKATHDDDSLSDSLSNYSFDITEQEREPPKSSEGNTPREKSPAPVHRNLPFRLGTQLGTKESLHPLPAVPALEISPPPLPPKETRLIPPRTGTQPFHIDRSKDRRQFANRPQAVHAGVPYGRPPARPIYKAATQANLRDAYRRASPLVEQTLPARGIHQPTLHPLSENSNLNGAAVIMTFVV